MNKTDRFGKWLLFETGKLNRKNLSWDTHIIHCRQISCISDDLKHIYTLVCNHAGFNILYRGRKDYFLLAIIFIYFDGCLNNERKCTGLLVPTLILEPFFLIKEHFAKGFSWSESNIKALTCMCTFQPWTLESACVCCWLPSPPAVAFLSLHTQKMGVSLILGP